MTAKKEAPAKRGRKAAPVDQRTEPFTVRLTPKIRYGIELLARSQKGRSLSQVVEWAIQRSLNSVLTRPSVTLGDILDSTWPLSGEWRRIRNLFTVASDLLDFVEKAICESILGSYEYMELMRNLAMRESHLIIESDGSAELETAILEMRGQGEAVFDRYITENWETLKSKLAEREAQGKPNDRIHLADIVGSRFEVGDLHDSPKRSRSPRKSSS